MTIRAAINGYGRIGRNVLRALYESGYRDRIEIAAINDLGDARLNAHLTRHDSVHGAFLGEIDASEKEITVNGDPIRALSERSPDALPWGELDIDIVFECTGLFTARNRAALHLAAGAKKVIVSAPSADADATIVYGVNHHVLKSSDEVISNASCTTNCLAPLAKVLHDAIGIVQGSMTTIHSYTNDQHLSDTYHKDAYRARSATQSMIPTQTGAAQAIGLVLPELDGKISGMAVRVPTVNVSLVDFNFLAARKTSADEIKQAIRRAVDGEMGKILTINEEPLVSVDFNHSSASSNFDATQVNVCGKWVKVMSWYDNEWGFSNRMLDNALALKAASLGTAV